MSNKMSSSNNHESNSSKVKLLVCGAVKGKFSTLASKLTSLHSSKAGPFDVCFCVGPFFSSGSNTNDESNLKEDAIALLSGSINLPLPVYFMDIGRLPEGIDLESGNTNSNSKNLMFSPPPTDKDEIILEESSPLDTILNQTSNNSVTLLAKNLYRLMGADIVSLEPGGLVVAYTSSTHVRYGTEETKNIEQKAKHVSYIGCDLFLSSEWAQGIADLDQKIFTSTDKERLKQSLLDSSTSTSDVKSILSELGSYDITEIASIVRPRYHFSSSSPALGHQYIASNPFLNLPSITRDDFHVCRFISLGNVISKEDEKISKNNKHRKYIHAVGIVPLVQMSRAVLVEQPSGTVNCPYGSSADLADATNRLGEAYARQLVRMESVSTSDATIAGTTEQQFRWSGRGVSNSGIVPNNYNSNKKRKAGADAHITAEELAEQDESARKIDNKCLFIHGIDRDTSGGAVLNMCSLLEAFKDYGCLRIRIPKRVGGGAASYAFAEFQTNAQAKLCLDKTNREISIAGIPLTLKWSSVGTIVTSSASSSYNHGVPPPPPPKKRRLTEQESLESDSLFCKLPATVNSADYETCLETVRAIAEMCLENAINIDVPEGSERVFAKDEPALAVAVRFPDATKGFGFLVFASHAAATMVATSLTGSIDGGAIFLESPAAKHVGDRTLLKKLEGVSLFWAKGTVAQALDASALDSQNQKLMVPLRKHHFPKDSRTDCWFCVASPTCEKHLIVAIKDSCYITMPKGAMSPFHCLIVPIEHKSQGALVHDQKTIEEVEAFKDQLRRYARDELHQDLFIFERAIQTKGGYHTHVQCIPLEYKHFQTLYATLMVMSREAGFELQDVNTDLSVKAMVKDAENVGYFYAEIPFVAGGAEQRRLIFIESSAPASEARENTGVGGTRDSAKCVVPLQFGRAVAAKLIGKPELTEWKACVVTEEEEANLACKLRDSLSKYG